MFEAVEESHTIQWQGLSLRVDYHPAWGGLPRCRVAHLEVIAVPRVPLPITETGYKSLFCPPDQIEDMGGAVAYVEAWLEHAARQPEWREAQVKAAQLSLF